MAIIIGAVLAVLSIAVVIYPFLKSRPWVAVEATPDAADQEGPDLEAIYEAVHTLQLDHQLGKVPEGLYREQLRAYRFQAAATLKQQAEAEARDADWELEQEIQVARASMSHLNGSAASCPNCGAAVSPGLEQCPECNIELKADQPDSRETPDR